MSNLERRTPRRELEKKAYRYGLATAGLAAATLVFFVLAVLTGFSFGWAALTGLSTFGAGYLFKKTVT